MNFNQSAFYEILPKDLYELGVYVSRKGFCLTFVGGVVRDFLLSGKLSHDIDIEIKHLFLYEEDQWRRMLVSLLDDISKKFSVTIDKKDFNVFSFRLGDNEIEFSSPRLEVFDNSKFNHKNFTPKYISNLNYKEAFSRRDFSLNAIGVFWGVCGADDEFTLVDPYHGLADLSNLCLRHISESFSNDPVRLLRLVRFKNKFNLSIDSATLNEVHNFNLTDISSYYVEKEFKKSDSLLFFKDLFEICEQYKVPLDNNLKNIDFLKSITNKSFFKFSLAHFMLWICLHQDITSKNKNDLCTYFKYSTKKYKFLMDVFVGLEDNQVSLKSVELVLELSKRYHLEIGLFNLEQQIYIDYKNNLQDIKFINKDQYLADKLELIAQVVEKYS